MRAMPCAPRVPSAQPMPRAMLLLLPSHYAIFHDIAIFFFIRLFSAYYAARHVLFHADDVSCAQRVFAHDARSAKRVCHLRATRRSAAIMRDASKDACA